MDAIELALFANRLRAVCREMGATLRRAALSPNIKDRLDYSCALFDARGELCAQAAHIPVHLGSMAYAMREVIGAVSWRAGDLVIVNDPFIGGTHLPDVTLIAPLCVDDRPVAFVANRAHHADIGCARPGSMPLARRLDEEGLVLAPRHLERAGVPDADTQALLAARLRNPRDTLADLAAQASANRAGLARLGELVKRMGADAFDAGLERVNAHAEALARGALAELPAGVYRHRDWLDGDGIEPGAIPLAVEVTLGGNGARVDFAGSAPAVAGNLNCSLAVTAAAVYYAFYALMPADTPPCAGSLRPIDIVAPPGCVLNARYPSAVAAGNCETSQRIVDLILGALAPALPARIPAASHGSMNNVAMGGAGWDYYETIGGGAGGHARGPGQPAVHTHMTNTLNTPVEVLEMTYPLRVRRYAVRRGTGGAGRHAGGDGLVREYEFLDGAAVTLLTERRTLAPWGLAGGAPGMPGENRLNGAPVPGKCELEVLRGDRLSIASAGGGGWGDAE
ncbi:MAG: hydantoinase B/oxoprolinase family protein [Gammaproteobacteria bacterium]|nr:hydantoinase B/oxoprolinase family protein [Gammaproteobacteria bacterium]